jgi:hypothetical protein
VTLTNRVQETFARLKPKFDDLADGYADLIDVDKIQGIVKIKQ